MSTQHRASTIFKIRGVKSWEKISKAQSFSADPLWFKTLINQDKNPPRIAFAISKKYGNAVKRNKCKRRINEVVGQLVLNNQIEKGTWILIGIKKIDGEITFDQIQKSLNIFVEKLKIKSS